MNTQFYQSASYVSPTGIKAENQQRQAQWDNYQQQQRRKLSTNRHLCNHQTYAIVAQRASMGDVPEDLNSETATRRKRADSHQPRSCHSHHSAEASHPALRNSSTYVRSSQDYDEQPRRFSSTDTGYAYNLSPQLSPSSPYSEVRRISGNFNAPTDVELERTREHRKSLKGVEKLRSKVKGWVRT